MPTLTNTAQGARGVLLADGTTIYIDAGATLTIDAEVASVYEGIVEGDATDDGLASHTVAELKAIAEAEGIDLGDATKKADIVSAIELAREG
ncbi:hypothetical protein PX699_13355 [Sphingobium sp. H39-3-25]|uniref:hypothetical protein n=1 Tax=Sphingobium arseniciresistens TaxID=3030834 RepID=UPI0023B9EAD5|nr:hypothetical protein [Sphingobium arseniciresistens]